MLGQAYKMLLVGAMIVLGILIVINIIRSVLGPGISDRIIAVNMIGTVIIMLIAILSLYLDESYLVDVCLIYAMISFLSVVVLCKVYTGVYLQRKNMQADLGAVEDNLRRQEERAAEDTAGETGSGAGTEAGESMAAGAERQTADEKTAPGSGAARRQKEVR